MENYDTEKSYCIHPIRMNNVYGAIYSFFPQTFTLPNEYCKFVSAYAALDTTIPRPAWICKPTDQSRGRGVFVFKDLKLLKYDCSCVVQKYVDRPFLIRGFKFDMRVYVLVTSYNPLTIYIYEEGLARFATAPYNTSTYENVYSHLTNTSINKLNPSLQSALSDYLPEGYKWTLKQLRGWFDQNVGKSSFKRVWERIKLLVILTLLPVAPEVEAESRGCFELYGFGTSG